MSGEHRGVARLAPFDHTGYATAHNKVARLIYLTETWYCLNSK